MVAQTVFLKELFDAAIVAAEPARCLKPYLNTVFNRHVNRRVSGRIVVLGAGKAGGAMVDLKYKMLRAEHVDALAAALAKYEVVEVNLNANQLGPEGAAKLAEALKTNTTLTSLECALAALEPMPSARSCGRAPGDPPSPLRAQPVEQRARRLRPAGRPRGRRQPH